MTSQNHNEDTAASKERNEIVVRLGIYEFGCHPDTITQILGLVPTHIWIAGQTAPGPPSIATRPDRVDAWLLESPLAGGSEIEEQVDALISALAPQADRFRDLPDNIYVELSCSVYGYEYMPAIYFTAEQVRFLASLDAKIDVDVYDLTEEVNE